MTDLAPPPGYVSLPPTPGNAFLLHCTELWGRLEGEAPAFGFRVLPHHCNPLGACHGGMLLTFVDSFLPNVPRFGPEGDDGATPTVSISTDFLSFAKLGDWVEGRGRLLRRTSNLIFVEGLVTVGDTLVMRASGIFKRGRPGDRAHRVAEMKALMRAARGDAPVT